MPKILSWTDWWEKSGQNFSNPISDSQQQQDHCGAPRGSQPPGDQRSVSYPSQPLLISDEGQLSRGDDGAIQPSGWHVDHHAESQLRQDPDRDNSSLIWQSVQPGGIRNGCPLLRTSAQGSRGKDWQKLGTLANHNFSAKNLKNLNPYQRAHRYQQRSLKILSKSVQQFSSYS